MITLYGISNCDTVRKARRWLSERNIDYRFHDFRKDGAPSKQIEAWVNRQGWEKLLNRRGQTWRKLPEKTRSGIDEKSAILLMKREPTLIKRPVLEMGRECHIGFSGEDYNRLFPT